MGIVDKAVRSTGKNLSLPILSCLLLEADSVSGNLNVRSTNLDIGTEFNFIVKCKVSGKVAVPASTLQNLLSSIKSDQNINIVAKEGNLEFSSKNNKSIIKCFPHEDFPEIPSVKKDKKCVLKSTEFINGLKNVWYSASNSSIKPELASVHVYPGGSELVFVATDSFRLAEKKIYYKNPTDFQPVLIPYKNVPDIIKILEGLNSEITVYFDKNQIEIALGNNKIISRVIDGSFPDYKQIIPKTVHTEATILKTDLVNIIRSAQVFSDSFNQIRFKFDSKINKIIVTSKNNDVGEFSESLESKITGDDLEISFNYKYIVDCMQSVESDSLSLALSGPGKPMIVRGLSDKSFMYIVMPMNK